MKVYFLLLLVSIFLTLSCQEDPTEKGKADVPIDKPITEKPADSTTSVTPSITTPLTQYFPPLENDTWDKINPDSLNWNMDSLQTLLSFLESKNTYGFMILYKGRIVTEKYWNSWNSNTTYPIASAGKSIVALLVGVAQEQGLLKITEKTSTYLGSGWTSMSEQKESMITLYHHLSMTTGLDETDENCISPNCLTYKADAGQRWAYHNAPYNLLQKIIEEVSDSTMEYFTRKNLTSKIGIKNSGWEDFNMELNTRDMARFGLLAMNKGNWNGQVIMQDSLYFKSMTTSSNTLNKSYGYLWWLNGQDSYMVPTENDVKPGSLTSHAPKDMFAAMGKGDKKIYVIPSLNMVVARHGDDTGASTFGPSSFDSELWKRLAPVISAMPPNK